MYPELGITGNVVARLLTSAQLNHKAHCLFMDRYYNSVLLFYHLHQNLGTYAIGTTMTNRRFFPDTIKNTKLRNRGESDYLSRENVSSLVWLDKRPIHFLSNCEDPTDMGVVNRRLKDGTQLEVPCPRAVMKYNSFMGGCDLNDQMTRLFKSRKHYRWPRRLFLKMVMWAVYNSYILYKEFTFHGKKLYFTQYLDKMCYFLIGTHRSAHLHRPLSGANIPEERRLQAVGIHMPEKIEDSKKAKPAKFAQANIIIF